MKIALLGYGRMGKAIEAVAEERGHEIIKRIDRDDSYDLEGADVAINFSIPKAAVPNLTACFDAGIPVVCGTTGWLDRYDEVVESCKEKNGGFLYASNFSVGVNIFFELNKQLAKMMAGLEQYNVSMNEIHHIHKLDAPSGTAITLAEGVIENSDYEFWALNQVEESNLMIHKTFPIKAVREGEVPGTHVVNYESEVDSISIEHKAHSRKGFALGAVIAAEWLQGKTGVFSMKDVLNLHP